MKTKKTSNTEINYVYPLLEWSKKYLNKNIVLEKIYELLDLKTQKLWKLEGIDFENNQKIIITIKESEFRYENKRRNFDMENLEIGEVYNFAWKINKRNFDMECGWKLKNDDEVKFFLGFKKLNTKKIIL